MSVGGILQFELTNSFVKNKNLKCIVTHQNNKLKFKNSQNFSKMFLYFKTAFNFNQILIFILGSFLIFGTINLQPQNNTNININLNLKEKNVSSFSSKLNLQNSNSQSIVYPENTTTISNKSTDSSKESISVIIILPSNTANLTLNNPNSSPIIFATSTIRTGGYFLGFSTLGAFLILIISMKNSRKKLKVQILTRNKRK